MRSSLLFLSGDEPLLSSSAATSASLYRSAPQIGGQRVKKDKKTEAEDRMPVKKKGAGMLGIVCLVQRC